MSQLTPHPEKRNAHGKILLREFVVHVRPLSPRATLTEILERFVNEPDLMSLPVTRGSALLGLVRRSCFFESDYVGRLGNAHLWNARKQVTELSCFQPCLAASPETPLEEAARLVSAREGASRQDDICMVHEEEYVGVVSVSVLLEALRQHLEARVEERTAELEATMELAETARQQAERANEAKSDFLSRMSHELRTPMNAILGFGQLLEIDNPRPRQRESLEHILRGGRHLLTLIDEVLDIARIESGKMALSLEAVSLRQVMHEAVCLMRPLAKERDITVSEVVRGAGEQWVWADRQRLTQVLLNLLSNAIKYNSLAGHVSLVAHRTAGSAREWRVTVTDSGPGIPAEQRGRLFQPFERLEAVRSTVQGTGLGLALCKRLVDLMGGGIGMEPAPGQGSSFFIDLRAAKDPLQTLSTAELPKPIEPAGDEAGAAATILYIEDNMPNFHLVECLLARLARVKLMAAMQGGIGLDLAREHRPDVILLDLHLPDLHGSEVLQRLQRDERTRQLPVIVISADATPGQAERLLAAGAAGYLTKPFDLGCFYSTLEEVLPRRALRLAS